MYDEEDIQKVKINKNFEQCKGMLEFAPGAASMYVEAISKDTELTEDEVKEIIQKEIDNE